MTESEWIESIPEGTDIDPTLDNILGVWRELATIAWEGFLVHGRGVVIVTPHKTGISVSYRPGSPCPCHQEWFDTYNPEEQVLIAVQGDDLYILGGAPSPIEAFGTTTADMLHATVH